MNSDRPLAPLAGSGSVRASSARTLARPANVHHALAPLISQPGWPSTSPGSARHAHRRDVGADVGLGHRDADHDLADGDARQPGLLLVLGAAGEQRLGQDLGPRDQRAGGGQRRPRQLLGGEDHREVAQLVAAVVLGHRQAEVAELAHGLDEALGDQLVVAVDVLGVGRDLLVGELADRRRGPRRASVERPGVAAAGLGDAAADGADRGLGAGAAHRGPDLAGIGRVDRVVVEAELVEQRAPGDRAAGAGQLGDRDRGGGGEVGVAAGAASAAAGELGGGAGLGRGVGDPIDHDLVVVDAAAAAGDLARSGRPRCRSASGRRRGRCGRRRTARACATAYTRLTRCAMANVVHRSGHSRLLDQCDARAVRFARRKNDDEAHPWPDPVPRAVRPGRPRRRRLDYVVNDSHKTITHDCGKQPAVMLNGSMDTITLHRRVHEGARQRPRQHAHRRVDRARSWSTAPPTRSRSARPTRSS